MQLRCSLPIVPSMRRCPQSTVSRFEVGPQNQASHQLALCEVMPTARCSIISQVPASKTQRQSRYSLQLACHMASVSQIRQQKARRFLLSKPIPKPCHCRYKCVNRYSGALFNRLNIAGFIPSKLPSIPELSSRITSSPRDRSGSNRTKYRSARKGRCQTFGAEPVMVMIVPTGTLR